MKESNGWIGVDLDGTLALYDSWNGGTVGEPIPVMVARVKSWIAAGREVRVVTARVGQTGRANDVGGVDDKRFCDMQREIIQDWCEQHIGVRLDVVASKDFKMDELWDDRAVRVRKNEGHPCCGHYSGEATCEPLVITHSMAVRANMALGFAAGRIHEGEWVMALNAMGIGAVTE